jgi:uncharacterized protein (DUF362 family)
MESILMSSSPAPNFHGITRRGFLVGAAAGVATAAPLGWLAARHLLPSRFSGSSTEEKRPQYGMPGRFRGRVIGMHNPTAVRPRDFHIDAQIVRKMVNQGVATLVDGDPKEPRSAWKSLFEPGDVVGIKVNPVGRKPLAGETGRVHNAVGCISSPEVVLAVVEELKNAGVEARDIIVFERYADEFRDAGYLELMKSNPMQGVRWYASAVRYTGTQLDIRGFDEGRDSCPVELARHVVGYDPDVFQHMGFCAPEHDTKDDRRFRSHLSVIVSRMINKLITIPCLKDHRSAGVTLALKNLSHGLNSNVARSHSPLVEHGLIERESIGPNQCNTFIPHAVAQLPTRQKATLHILDGLIGVYEGGPGSWNKTWGTWICNSLFFATDPVAMDHVGWDIVDRKRAEMGWAPVARMGLTHLTPAVQVSSEFAALAGQSPLDASVLGAAAKNLREGRASEGFDLRTPQHIPLAGMLGLGEFDPNRIDYRLLKM